MRIDPDAVLWSAPEPERAGRPLLVLLHGYGSHEGDLFGLSPRLPLEPVIASLRAPIAESGGWAWFPRTENRHGNPDPAGVDAAAAAVLAWLDTVDYTKVSLLGFSQGAAVALQLLRQAPRRFAGTVALSGFVADGTGPGPGDNGTGTAESAAARDIELESARPRVFWGRGTDDTVIPAEAIERTARWLPQHTDLTERVYEDLAHGVSAAELTEVATFLRATASG